MDLENLKALLNYVLIKKDTFTLSVYELFLIVIVLFLTAVILRFIKHLFKRAVKRDRFDKGTALSIYSIVKYLTWIIVILLLLETTGVKVSILIASAAALLVGIGLGLQQFFNDVASGFVILIERTLKVDDVMELDDHTVGRVTSIGIRTSKLKTRDNVITIVPNSKLVNDRVINWSHLEDKTRFYVNIGVAYGSDVELVTKILKNCTLNHENIILDPPPFVRFIDFGESSLDFQLFFWTNLSFEVENTKSDLRYKIEKAFRENRIQIPFPQRDIHVKTTLPLQ